jgi:glycosyltransferase involved in cell wall biosynthesis
MKYNDEKTALKESEIENKIILKSKKQTLFKYNESDYDCYFFELISLSLLFSLALLFIISCIIMYISKINKTYVTEEDNIKLKIKIKNYLDSYYNLNELERGDTYYELCNLGILFRTRELKAIEKPKISIIIITNNNENKILILLRSIQNQNFEEIEIIIIDNNSKDKTVDIIEKVKKEDLRIKLIRNVDRKEKLENIKNGISNSKGEYILLADPNDIYADRIFYLSYTKAKENNFDIVGFIICTMHLGIHDLGHNHKINTPIYQPQLSSLMFYENGYINQTDKTLWNKLIKREVLINATNLINNYYLNQNLDINGDSFILFILYKISNSFYFINNFGYIYNGNHGSLMTVYRNNLEKIIKDYFLYLKFMFENTKNSRFEKDIVFYIFRKQYNTFYNKKNVVNKITKDFRFYFDVIDLYLNCKYITQKDKIIIEDMKNKIKNRQMKLNMTSIKKSKKLNESSDSFVEIEDNL